MRDSLCAEYPKHLFFPERGASCVQAKAICHACLVRSECLAFALHHPQGELLIGIWGGTSARERRMLRRTAA